VNPPGKPRKKEGSFARPKGSSRQGGIPPLAQKGLPVDSRTDFSSTTLDPPKDGEQLFERVIFTMEKNLARRLGTSERVEEWQTKTFFKAARREWLGAWKRFATWKGFGRGSLFDIQAGIQQTLEPEKAFTLTSLRLSNRPDFILRRRAIVIALSKGDPEFLKKIRLASRSGKGRKGGGAFLSYSILCYWFPGQLWLMNEEAGYNALRAYTGNEITKSAYRKACSRLDLKGYKHRMRDPAVSYDPKTGSYLYAPKWTKMERKLTKFVHVTS
jgi:hypothetical protein